MRKREVEIGHKRILDSLLLGMPGVAEGKMFGHDAYYVNGKLFACVYGDGVGVKVPERVANALLSKKRHVAPFRPYGKPQMREWIQLHRARSSDYRRDMEIFRTAAAFVRRVQATKRRKK